MDLRYPTEVNSLGAWQTGIEVQVDIMAWKILALAYGTKETQVLGIVSTLSCLPVGPLCLPPIP